VFDIYFIVALLLGVTVHEFCHSWAATMLGDETSKHQGRLTLNPIAHLDVMGTILLLIAGFGWGKPVPFDPRYLKNPRVGSALISLAGPMANFALVIIFGVAYHFLNVRLELLTEVSTTMIVVVKLFQAIISLNFILMIFNLLPIPPLDGSKIFALLIPGRYLPVVYEYRNFGYVALILVVFSDRLFGVPILSYIFGPLFELLWGLIL
jgi:Zn-dependent protease